MTGISEFQKRVHRTRTTWIFTDKASIESRIRAPNKKCKRTLSTWIFADKASIESRIRAPSKKCKILRTYLCSTMGMILLLLISPVSVEADTAGVLYQEGLFEESAIGDPNRAIEIYNRILTEHAEEKGLVGKARLRIAICYELLGEKERAIVSYEEVIEGYRGEEDLFARVAERLDRLREALREKSQNEGVYLIHREGGPGISGTVRDLDGRPVSDARMRIAAASLSNGLSTMLWEGPEYAADERGRYAITDLVEGRYVLQIWSDSLQSRAQIEEVDAGRTDADVVMGRTNRISGRITDTKGRPIPNALVQTLVLPYRQRPEDRWYEHYVTSPSDSDGGYELTDLPFSFGMSGEGPMRHRLPRPWRWIIVSAKGYVTRMFRPRPGPAYGQHLTDLDIELEPGGVCLAGVVRDTLGYPIVGAEIGVCPAGRRANYGGHGETGEGGRFLIEGHVEEFYNLVVSAGGFAPTYVTRAMGGREDIEVVLTGGGAITGSVREVLSGGSHYGIEGRPVPNAVVLARYRSNGLLNAYGITDQDGNYRIGNLAPGAYLVQADRRGTPDLMARGLTCGRERPVEVREGEVISGVDLFLRPGRAVSGRVTYRDTGEPVPGIVVRLSGPRPVSAVTDEEGRYRFEGVGKGQYALATALGGYSETPRRSVVQVGEEDVEGMDVQLVRRGNLTVTITDPEGHPVPDATVRCTWPDRATDSTGTCRLEDLEPDLSHRVFADHPTYAYAMDFVTLDPGEDREVTLRLPLGRSLEGRVLDWTGHPVGGALIRVGPAVLEYVSSRSGREMETDTAGYYRADRLPPGDVRIFVSDLMDDETEEELRFAVQETTMTVRSDTLVSRCDITVRPGGMLIGRVLDENDEPASRARVHLDPWRYYPKQIVTDSDGSFRAERVSAGTYRVSTSWSYWGGLEGGEEISLAEGDSVWVELRMKGESRP